MTEDKFDDFLKKAAQSYNVPPVHTPREEMWSAIQAKRSAGPRVVYGGGSVRDSSERRFGSRIWVGAAAAAVLLLATGIGLGRWSAATDAPGKVPAANPITAHPLPATPLVPGDKAVVETTPNIASSGSATEQANTERQGPATTKVGGQSE